MTAKEKAKELINKMDVIHYIKLINKNSKGLPVSMYDDQIKQCALICVDEIIKVVDDNCLEYDDHYWQEVKKEIELL